MKNIKNKITLSDIVCAFIILLSALISGLLNLFTYGFNPTELLTISFWLAILIRCLANGLVLFSSAINRISHLERDDEQISYLKNSLQLSIKNDIKEDFVTFLAAINKQEKIKKYKQKINRKIFKLDNHASHRRLNKWKLYQDEKEIISVEVDPHQYGRYVFKRQKLLDKLEDEYIEKNIDSIRVKYNYITRNMIINNFKTNDDEKYTLIEKNKKMARDLLPRFLYTISFTLIMSSIILDPNIENLNVVFWINFTTNIFTLIFSYFTGNNYGKDFTETVIIGNYYTKKQVIDDYKIWKSRGA